jgi:hypothetical protein
VKLKCFIHKGTELQRIRKVSVMGISSLDTLYQRVRSEFEMSDDTVLKLSYTDSDGDTIEITSSTAPEEVVADAKVLTITSVTNSS